MRDASIRRAALLAAAISAALMGACYDLTPVLSPDDDGGACTPDPTMPDACAPSDSDAGSVGGGEESDADAAVDAGSTTTDDAMDDGASSDAGATEEGAS
ncbi:MAG TPA: hypothetical protein VGL13_15945 [Polyangiaceae bacterium]